MQSQLVGWGGNPKEAAEKAGISIQAYALV